MPMTKRLPTTLLSVFAILLMVKASPAEQENSGPIDFSRNWIRAHPFTLMASATGSAPDFNVANYLDMNLNVVFANNNPPVAEAAASAGVPWHMHYNSSARPLAPFTDSDKQLIGQWISMGHAAAWMLPDVPMSAGEYQSLGESARWMRENYPDLFVYVDIGRGDGLSGEVLREMVDAICPDALMFFWFPFREDGTTDIDRWFADLTSVRAAALDANIAYWGWLQSLEFEYRRIPSESDTRFNGFTLLTAGYTGLGYFAFDGVGILFNADGTPTELNRQAAEANIEYANLGKALRFLKSTDLRFISGANGASSPSIKSWTAGAGGDVHIQAIVAARATDGLIGFFTDDKGQQYFMLTNLHHGPGLSAEAGRIEYEVQFGEEIERVWRLNRITGRVEEIKLENHVLKVGLPGGTGDLFKYDVGQFPGLEPSPSDGR